MKIKDLQKGLKKRGIEAQIVNATPNKNEHEEEIISRIKKDIEELSRFVGAKDWTMAAIINNRIQREVRKMMEKK